MSETNREHCFDVLSSNAAPKARLGAALFDFLIVFLPIGLVAIAPLRQSLVRNLLMEEELKISLTMLMIGFGFFFLFFIYQVICLYLFQCTAGQRVFGLRVFSIIDPERGLGLSQAAVRSFIWVISLFTVVPFIGVLGHRHRRTLHDRIADTKVISFKENVGPIAAFESGLYNGALMGAWLLILSVIAVISTYLFAYLNDERMLVRHLEKSGELCKEVGAALETWSGKSEIPFGVERLDVATALFLAKRLNKECLQKELDYLSQTIRFEDARLYFAKYLSAEQKDEKEAYRERVCRLDSNSDLCLLTREADFSAEEIESIESWSWPGLVALFERARADQNYVLLENILKDLVVPRPLGTYFAKLRAQALWYRGESNLSREHVLTSLNLLGMNARKDLSAWACQEELDLDCRAIEGPACRLFEKQLNEDFETLHAVDESLAIIIKRYCEDPTEAEWKALEARLKQPQTRAFARAVKLIVQKKIDSAREQLSDLLPRADGQFKYLLEKMLLMTMSEDQELTEARSAWLDKKSHSPMWYKSGRAFFDHYFEQGQFIKAVEVGQFLTDSFVDNNIFAQNFVLAAYHAGAKPLAYERLVVYKKRFPQDQIANERAPAAQSEFLVIKKVLENEFEL